MGVAAIAVPLITALVDVFRNKRAEVARQTGVSETVVGQIGDMVQDYLTKDEKAMQAMMAEIDKARDHDAAMNTAAMPPVVNLLRGIVRPVITLTAFVWYVYARAVGIELGAEDYAIIGGIMAFWFGFRPFEKRGGGAPSGTVATPRAG